MLAPHIPIEHVVSGGRPNLYLIEDMESLIKIASPEEYQAVNPPIRSTFDVYPSENMLIYVKEPCAEDVQETFFLHVDPVDASDLPEHRKQYGFDNLGFRFNDQGFRSAERCVARQKLPDYPITRIHTGQYNDKGRLWEVEVRFDE